jgi:hypothetical protein
MLVAMIPELRRHFLRRRLFLTEDSAWFDLVLAGLLTAAVTRRRTPSVAAALAYAARLERRTRGAPVPMRAWLALGRAAADAVTFASLVRGSVAARTVVL